MGLTAVVRPTSKYLYICNDGPVVVSFMQSIDYPSVMFSCSLVLHCSTTHPLPFRSLVPHYNCNAIRLGARIATLSSFTIAMQSTSAHVGGHHHHLSAPTMTTTTRWPPPIRVDPVPSASVYRREHAEKVSYIFFIFFIFTLATLMATSTITMTTSCTAPRPRRRPLVRRWPPTCVDHLTHPPAHSCPRTLTLAKPVHPHVRPLQ